MNFFLKMDLKNGFLKLLIEYLFLFLSKGFKKNFSNLEYRNNEKLIIYSQKTLENYFPTKNFKECHTEHLNNVYQIK
jgi:hypothetical protein